MNRANILAVFLIATAIILSRDKFMGNWKESKNAEKYLPILNAAESRYGIPRDLLARLAYQESRFRDDIVSGAVVSAAGAVGIMQLVPRFHPTASPLDVSSAIDYAARFLTSLRSELGSWRLALAGYNAGAGNIKDFRDGTNRYGNNPQFKRTGGIPTFSETQKYVREITTDVPVS